MLKETFKTHELTRTEILNQIFNRIIVHAESSQAAVSLLSSIVESNFYDISKDFEHKVRFLWCTFRLLLLKAAIVERLH